MRRRNLAPPRPWRFVDGLPNAVGIIAPAEAYAVAQACYLEFQVFGLRLSPWPIAWTRSSAFIFGPIDWMPSSPERATFTHNILKKVSFKRVDRDRAMFLISRTWTKFAHIGLRPSDAMLMAPPSSVGELPLAPSDLEFAAPLRGGEDVHDRLDREDSKLHRG